MQWRRHGDFAHPVLPKELIEHRRVHRVGSAEIQLLAFFPFLRVDLVQQAFITIKIVRGEQRVLNFAAKIVTLHNVSQETIVGVHRRNAQ